MGLSVASTALYNDQFGFQHIRAQCSKNFFSSCFFSYCNVVRYSLSLSHCMLYWCVHLRAHVHTHIYGRVTKSIVFYNLFANGCFVIFAVPISIYILSLQLPYLPEATSLSPFFLLGSLILVSGLVIYSIPQPAKHYSRDG